MCKQVLCLHKLEINILLTNDSYQNVCLKNKRIIICQFRDHHKNVKSMVVAISGATGFIGRRLTSYLESKGINVVAHQREDYKSEALLNKIDRCDAVINLAGESIFKRWTNSSKKRILSSRIDTTRQIVECMNRSKDPKILISTSAVGYYAKHVTCDEYKYTKGSDFLAEVCSQWEAEALKCDAIHRTIITRFGIVLDKDGGALEKMLRPMKLGFASIIGDGKQAFSWIALDDLLRAIEYLILNTDCKGIYNLTAPQPTTNLELTQNLASKMNLSLTFSVPKFIFSMTMGKSSSLLVNGQYVLPTRLIQDGFQFHYKTIQKYIQLMSAF